MGRLFLFIAMMLAACTPQPKQDIETDFDQRIAAGGLSGMELADAYIDRGILHLAKREPDAALADFDLALKTVPDLAEAYVWRGVALDIKGDKVGEKASYERALAIDPDYWFAHGSLGMMLAKGGEDDLALAELSRAVELGKPHEGEYFVREIRQRQFLTQSRIGKPIPGTSTQTLAISANDRLAFYRIARAGIFLKRNDQEAALAESQEAVRLAPSTFLAHMQLSQLLATLGQCEEAKAQMAAMGKQSGIIIAPTPTEKCPKLGLP